jgi:hypothetical protein
MDGWMSFREIGLEFTESQGNTKRKTEIECEYSQTLSHVIEWESEMVSKAEAFRKEGNPEEHADDRG